MAEHRTGAPGGPPAPGDVWRYPYLWAREHEAGETEGRKPRPCALAVTVRRRDGLTGIVLLAITTQPPAADRVSIEISPIERRRAGLDPDRPLWLILDEHNTDLLERSAYLEPGDRIGRLSGAFTKRAQQAFIETIRARRSRAVPRFD